MSLDEIAHTVGEGFETVKVVAAEIVFEKTAPVDKSIALAAIAAYVSDTLFAFTVAPTPKPPAVTIARKTLSENRGTVVISLLGGRTGVAVLTR